MRLAVKGQVTIPKQLRDQLGIGAGTEVDFVRHGDALVLRKAGDSSGGRRLVERVPGRADVQVTIEEVMALTREP